MKFVQGITFLIIPFGFKHLDKPLALIILPHGVRTLLIADVCNALILTHGVIVRQVGRERVKDIVESYFRGHRVDI